jgi:ABC-type polysaccharide/polyol phosphate transport system ATPase subunit
MRPILEIQNVGKRYVISHESAGYLSLRERLFDTFRKGKNREEFWALKDVSFEVKPGDSVGIIGRNGAGKSTLLKILSRITPPTKGRTVARGRVASLLEVGTGFHPELTGRENIFLNGSLLGMRRSEIESKFDEIVDFSGVERFLDTPLKHFSSGMQLRLAFAVAAFLEPEILIIDEVLAVGDAEFQKKCLGKMEDVSRSGRTVLFVSHNLPTLKAICQRGILLEKGEVSYDGDIDTAVYQYLSSRSERRTILKGLRYFRAGESVGKITINGSEENRIVLATSKILLEVEVTFARKMNFELQVHLKKDDSYITSYAEFAKKDVISYDPGSYRMAYEIEFPDIRSGKYTLDIYFTEPFVTWFANSFNDVEIEFINDSHQVYLNGPSFNWWSPVLLSGKMMSVDREN